MCSSDLLAALFAPGGRLAMLCQHDYELRLHRARGYGALKAILEILGDERVWNAIYNTFLYTGVALVFQLVLGMLIALLLDSDRKGYGILRALMTLPLVIPPAVTGMMFLLMLNGSFGVLSRGLIALGLLPTGFSILGTADTFLPTEKKFFLSHWGDVMDVAAKAKKPSRNE